MIVVTITDTDTENTHTVVDRNAIVQTLFSAAEVALEGADEDGTGISYEDLTNVWEITNDVQKFLRAQG